MNSRFQPALAAGLETIQQSTLWVDNMQLLAQQHVGCPTAVQRHESIRPIRHACVCSMRRPSQQHKYIKLGSSQSVSLSKHPALMPTFRHAQQCCMAQAKNVDGLELPNPQVDTITTML